MATASKKPAAKPSASKKPAASKPAAPKPAAVLSDAEQRERRAEEQAQAAVNRADDEAAARAGVRTAAQQALDRAENA